MRPGKTYQPHRTIRTFGPTDEPIELREGVTYECIGTGLLRASDNSVLEVPEHIRINSSWYLKSGFNPQVPRVSQLEYVTALARSCDGLEAGALFANAQLERFGPLEKDVPYSGFTRCLTQAVADGRLEMQKDGVVVTQQMIDSGVVKKIGCTYHKPAPQTRNRDGLFAA